MFKIPTRDVADSSSVSVNLVAKHTKIYWLFVLGVTSKYDFSLVPLVVLNDGMTNDFIYSCTVGPELASFLVHSSSDVHIHSVAYHTTY